MDDYEDSKTLSVSILSIVLYTVLVPVICSLSILYITRHVLYCSLVLLGAVTVTAVHTIPRFYAMIPKKMPNAVPVTAEEYEMRIMAAD